MSLTSLKLYSDRLDIVIFAGIRAFRLLTYSCWQKWWEYWTLFTFVRLHRMGDQTVCANHCMISRHASKVPSKMMLEKMRAKGWIWSDREPGGYQRATQNYLRSLWLITDRVRVHTQALFYVYWLQESFWYSFLLQFWRAVLDTSFAHHLAALIKSLSANQRSDADKQ